MTKKEKEEIIDDLIYYLPTKRGKEIVKIFKKLTSKLPETTNGYPKNDTRNQHSSQFSLG